MKNKDYSHLRNIKKHTPDMILFSFFFPVDSSNLNLENTTLQLLSYPFQKDNDKSWKAVLSSFFFDIYCDVITIENFKYYQK